MNLTEGRGASGISVFVAEDDADFRATLAAALRLDGHTVFEASNGDTMLFHLAQQGSDRTLPSGEEIVVCDIRMPGCDGLTVLRNLREHDTDCPPFIFTSAFPDAEIVREAHELGALTVFEKPFDLRDLRELVRRHARKARPL
jgi:two-component system response regulator (stage 0 sporulation protein F)